MALVSHLLPAGADLDGARTTLAEHLELRAGRARTASATFYDTFDGRLHGDGLTLRFQNGRLSLEDRMTGEELAAAEHPASRRLFDADLPVPLRSRLAPVIEMRALLPVARVRARQLPLLVLNGDDKTVVRLTLEIAPGLHGRVSATAVRGYERELERVHE